MGRTTRRIRPGGAGAHGRLAMGLGREPDEETQAMDLARLTDLVQRQQDVIVEYAAREVWAEKAFRKLAVDNGTATWLHGMFGASCELAGAEARTKRSSSEAAGTHFNTAANLKRLETSQAMWSGATQVDAKALFRAVLLDASGSPRLAGLDVATLDRAVDACGASAQQLSHLDAMACVLRSMRPFDGKATTPLLTDADVLACMLAALTTTTTPDPGASDEVTRRVLAAADVSAGLGDADRAQFSESLETCIASRAPQAQWEIVRTLDMLTTMVIEDASSPLTATALDLEEEATRKKALPSVPVFTEAALSREVFVRGAFRAACNDEACRPTAVADALLGDGTEALVKLNVLDFVAAPVWVALAPHVPALQAPLGLLLANREMWLKQLPHASSDPALHELVHRRTLAFADTFMHVRYDSKTAAEVEAGVTAIAAASAGQRRSTQFVRRHDFMELQERAIRCTGAGAKFLALLSSNNSQLQEQARHALARTIGLLKGDAVDGDGGDGAGAGNGAGLRGSATANTVDGSSFYDMDKDKSASSKVGSGAPTPSMERRGSNLTLLPRSMMKSSNAGPGDVLDGIGTLQAQRMDCKKRVVHAILTHNVTGAVLAILTIFALFGDDLKLANFSLDADAPFGWVTLLTFVLFSLEIFAKMWLDPGYKNGFFFWLDVLATVSLIPDIPVMWDALVAGVDPFGTEADDLTLTRAGRASRAGARAARMIRILRLVRLLRILKLYEYVSLRRDAQKERKKSRKVSHAASSRYVSRYLVKKRMSVTARRSSALHRPAPTVAGGDPLRQSKVGAKLADLTTRRVIMVVLMILFVLPIINIDETDQSVEAAVGMLHVASMQYHDGLVNETSFHASVDSFILGSPALVFLKTDAFDGGSPLFGTLEAEAAFRPAEIRKSLQFCYDSSDPAEVMEDFTYCAVNATQHPVAWALTTRASYDNRGYEREAAWRSILQTIFIIVIFGAATMVFTYDAHALVIAPIEKMVRIVEELAENPLTTFDNDDSDDDDDDDGDGDGSGHGEDEATREARRRKKKAQKEKKEAAGGGYETKLLENCIKKIGGLLQVGFGEAGAEIIASNLNGSGELDPMVPGRKVQAVFGFCDIRNFMVTTEVLREEVMLYVNEIANIVHTQVSAHSGNANRNMGDSFLLVWKRHPAEDEGWMEIVEKALISFLKVTIEVNSSQELQVYQSASSKTGARLRSKMPDFKVQLGFGLHIGWAIEGAIGSNRKIDASYLSPHVNLTSRLEEVTRHYGVNILFSGDLHDLLSDDAKKCSRKVDVVKLKGTRDPVALYTYDCNYANLDVKLQSISLKGNSEEEATNLAVDRRISLVGPSPIIDHVRNIAQIQKSAFRTDLELRALQWDLPPHFLPLCRKAVAVYVSGRWKEAKVLMEAACKMVPSEAKGPCGAVLTFMQSHDFKAPEDWPGSRMLRL